MPGDSRTHSVTRLRRLGRRLFAGACWTSLGVALAAWVAIRVGCDRWWFGTLLLYGPLWAFAVPALALAPFAVAVRRPRLLWPLVASGLIVVGPLMGLEIPSRSSVPEAAQANRPPGLRLMTWNCDGTSGDAAMLLRLLDREGPDVVALQEWAGQEAASSALKQLGWHVSQQGSMALMSRFPVVSAEPVPSEEGWRNIAVHYTLRTPHGLVRVSNVHLETPRKGLEALIAGGRAGLPEMRENGARRWRESERVSRGVNGPEGCLIAGDFNMPVDSVVYRRFWSEYENAFSAAGWGYGHTKRVRWWGTRIDHVLAGRGWSVRSCRVLDVESGSSHRPVLAELRLGLLSREP